MPKVILDQPQVVAAVGQRKAAGMSKQVHGRQPGMSRPPRRADSHRLTRERLPTFGDEQPGQRIGAAGQVPLDRAEFIAGCQTQSYLRIGQRYLRMTQNPL